MQTCGRTDRRTDRHLDMAKLVEALRIMPTRLRVEEDVTDSDLQRRLCCLQVPPTFHSSCYHVLKGGRIITLHGTCPCDTEKSFLRTTSNSYQRQEPIYLYDKPRVTYSLTACMGQTYWPENPLSNLFPLLRSTIVHQKTVYTCVLNQQKHTGEIGFKVYH